jgi:hypothetical protein
MPAARSYRGKSRGWYGTTGLQGECRAAVRCRQGGSCSTSIRTLLIAGTGPCVCRVGVDGGQRSTGGDRVAWGQGAWRAKVKKNVGVQNAMPAASRSTCNEAILHKQSPPRGGRSQKCVVRLKKQWCMAGGGELKHISPATRFVSCWCRACGDWGMRVEVRAQAKSD